MSANPYPDCPDCTEAWGNYKWAGIRSYCWGCRARALSFSPAHVEASQAQAITGAYKHALYMQLGEQCSKVADAHERVQTWARRAEELRKGARK